MNKSQLELLQSAMRKGIPGFCISGEGHPEGTLLYGYTLAISDTCYTVHVYMKDEGLHHIRYTSDNEVVLYENGRELPVKSLVKDIKRFYPESCDFDFCMEVLKLGEWPTVTTFDPERFERVKEKIYHGKTAEDFYVLPVPQNLK
jgi:hypothetical protein